MTGSCHCSPGLFYTEDMAIFQDSPESGPASELIGWILGIIPGYKQLTAMIDYWVREHTRLTGVFCNRSQHLWQVTSTLGVVILD